MLVRGRNGGDDVGEERNGGEHAGDGEGVRGRNGDDVG